MSITVAIGMSGGIDSLVAGFLLKRQYKKVFGIHFTTGYETENIDFSFIENQLDIQIVHIDLHSVFEKTIVDYFIQTYLKGKTPNPCLICNKTIKFGSLIAAAETHGATLFATGHYARIQRDKTGQIALLKGKDPLKEQSYFLSMLGFEQLEKAVFPLENMTKKEVHEFAETHHLCQPVKKESQDICFIKDSPVADFISLKTNRLFRPGDIVTKENKVIGRHNGLHRFTIGQRRGINCPGPYPYYVLKIDTKNNKLVVGSRQDLLQKAFYIQDINYLTPHPEFPSRVTAKTRVTAKIRYAHKGAPAFFINDEKGGKIIFDTPQPAVTPGQAAVLYSGDQVVCAGIIQ
ncbi:MAG: tRNA 2-thiouridine(34) synthase MnmA [Desulfobacteraceae bacterium]